MRYPQHLQRLIHTLKRLPGVGNKSAERFAFEMISWPDQHLQEIASTVSTLHKYLKKCIDCGCLMDERDGSGCYYCEEKRVETRKLCILASPKDVYAIEETGEYKGLYHILGGLLSPMDGVGPETLSFSSLTSRLQKNNIQEVIIALDSTLEGDTTSLFIRRELEGYPVNVTRLAFGIPMGSSLDYVDGGTLARALSSRGQF